jgi:O-succinylbenzoate synthase
MTAWSYSSIKTFDQCPKKYFHLKVVKDVKDTPGEAADYGTAVHLAAEEYIRNGTPIPDKFAFMRPIVERLEQLPGEKHAELKLGIRKDFSPCDFFAKDVWWRGVADLVVVDGHRAWCVDYKTGKNARYADTKQLDLLAGALFSHFPEVTKVKSSLLYVVSGNLIPKKHMVTERSRYLAVFDEQLDRLDAAMENGVWNAKTSPLCGWCPVTSCEHWKPRRK